MKFALNVGSNEFALYRRLPALHLDSSAQDMEKENMNLHAV